MLDAAAAGRQDVLNLNGDSLAQLMWSFATVAEARVAVRGARAAGAQERRGARVHTSAQDYGGGRVPELLARCWPEVPVADIMHALMRLVAAQRPHMQSEVAISNTLWAAATVSLHNEEFVAHMEYCVAQRASSPPGMGVQSAATCLWALGRLAHVSPGTSCLLATSFVAALREESRRDGDVGAGMHTQAVSMAMHACATLACGTREERRLLRLGQRFIARHRRHAGPQALTVALWASAVAEEYSQHDALAALLQVRPPLR